MTSPDGTGRSWRAAALAAAALTLFYGLVVGGASGSVRHLLDQAAQDWYYLVAIIGGFGLQVGLLAELRRRHTVRSAATAAGGAGAGASTAGMVACCAHHLADLAPFVGATGAAAFLTDNRVAFMLVGIGVNSLGVAVAARRLVRDARHHGHPGRSEEVPACAAV